MDEKISAATLRLFLGAGPVRVLQLSTPAAAAIDASADAGVSAGGILAYTEGSETAVVRRCIAALALGFDPDRPLAFVVANRMRAWLRGLHGGTSRKGALPGASPRSVCRLLRQAGFNRLQIHSIAQRPGGALEVRTRSAQDIWRADAYLVVARRSQGEPSQLDAVLQRLEQAGASARTTRSCSLVSLGTSGKDKSIARVECGEQDLVVRLPHSDAAFTAEARAHATLQALHREGRLRGRIPHPVDAANAAGQAFFAETRAPGSPLALHLTASSRARYAAAVGRMLAELNPAPDSHPQMQINRPALELLPALVEPVLSALGEPTLRRRALAVLERELHCATYRQGIVHGDLSVSNVLVQGTRISGLVDWENSSAAGPMLLDAFNYLDSAQRHCSGSMTLADTVPMLAGPAWPVQEERQMLAAHFERCGTDLRFRRGFALLYFFAHVGPQLAFSQDARAVQARVRGMLENVLAALGQA